MKKKLVSFVLALSSVLIINAQQQEHHIIKTFHIASGGGWDYIAANNGKLYVSHGTQVNILDEQTGDSIGIIPNTTGVHGIAFNNAANKGYTSNGRLNNVTVFDLKTNQVLSQISTGENPDAILYEPFSKTIITCNGRSNNLSVIDATTEKVIATIPVGGKPETAVTDEKGKLFVNIEDKSEIAAVDLKSFKVLNRWSIAPGESPSGLAIDKATGRLFAGCDNKLLMVIDDNTGKVVSQVPIGDGCDGVAFDNATKTIYSSNGEGTLTIIKEQSANAYKVLENFSTKRGARTLALDEKTHTIFLPTAGFEVATAPNERPKMIPGTFQVLAVQ